MRLYVTQSGYWLWWDGGDEWVDSANMDAPCFRQPLRGCSLSCQAQSVQTESNACRSWLTLCHIPSHSSSKPWALQPACVATVRSFKSYDSKRRQTKSFSLLQQPVTKVIGCWTLVLYSKSNRDNELYSWHQPEKLRNLLHLLYGKHHL